MAEVVWVAATRRRARIVSLVESLTTSFNNPKGFLKFSRPVARSLDRDSSGSNNQ